MKLRVGLLAFVFLVASTMAQNSSTSVQVPHLVKVSGVLNDVAGKAFTGIVGVTFSLYKDQQGGAALWMETQNVQVNGSGHYSVTLGDSKAEGLPADLFAAGQARWLGVQPTGQAEQARILLLSVPYALKAGDADTIGGLPPSAFVLAGTAGASSGTSSGSAENVASSSATNGAQPAVSGTGTTNFVPLWTSSTALGNSVLFQTGSGGTAKVGIGTTTPGATLDVSGAANIEGLLTLPSIGKATAAAGKNSQAHDMVSSSYSSTKKAAVAQDFRWQAEPVGNNSASPSGTLNLLFGSGGTAPGETGLKLSSKGLFTFAAGQTFPGTGAGTITGVTAGSGLAGGGTSGNVTLSLLTSCAASQVLEWNGSKWICASAGTGTITGVAAGTDLTGGGVAGNVTLNLDTTKVPQLATANTFTNNNLVVGTGGSSFALMVTPPDAPTNSGLPGTPALYSQGSSADLNGLAVGGSGVVALGGDGGSANVSGNGGDGIDTSGGTGNGGGGGRGISANGGFGNVLNGGDGVGASGGDSSFLTGGNGVTATGGGGGGSDQGHAGNGVVGVGGGSFGFGGGDGSGGIFTGGSNAFAGFGIEAMTGSGGAGFFSGDVIVTGAISAGTKDFKIDHPLDPANKYLYHASVESSEMLNIYTGNVTTDAQGDAQVHLPDWFDAVNTDFRYQLTVIGQIAQAIVSSKVANQQFAIKTDKPNVEVSWQITGVRQDAFAKAHPLVVEQAKSEHERGFYLHPELYGAPEEKGISWAYHPDTMKQMKALRERKNAPAIRKPASRLALSAKTGTKVR